MAGRIRLMQFTGFGALLCASMMNCVTPSLAGFELTGSQPQQARQAPAAVAQASEAPMPILPAAPVTAEPLAAPDPILAPSAISQSNADPVYIRRQRSVIPMKAPANQPMDTDALLKATVDTAPVSVAPQMPGAANPYTSSQSGLVINPYPLQNNGIAKGGNMGAPSLDQAMMEDTGYLRPVATPGKSSTAGMIARAKISSRYSSGAQYLSRDDSMQAAAPSSFTVGSDLTPIPGGEGQPLAGIERASLAPVISARPVLEVPRTPVQMALAAPETQNAGSYMPAVGFGRDLPLALALSQVVPPDFTYSFGQNVDMGANVTWQGGKPWNEVVNDMLAPTGMKAVVQGQKVVIQNPTT